MRLNTECKGKFKIERRAPIYHTHSNVIDDSIDSIQTYAIRPNKFLILLIFYFLTFGILYLLRLIFPSILIFFACSEEIPEQSNYVKVYDRNGKSYVLLLNNVNLYESNILFRNKKITSISKTELKNKHYVGIEKADSIVARAIQKIPKNIPNLKKQNSKVTYLFYLNYSMLLYHTLNSHFFHSKLINHYIHY